MSLVFPFFVKTDFHEINIDNFFSVAKNLLTIDGQLQLYITAHRPYSKTRYSLRLWNGEPKIHPFSGHPDWDGNALFESFCESYQLIKKHFPDKEIRLIKTNGDYCREYFIIKL